MARMTGEAWAAVEELAPGWAVVPPPRRRGARPRVGVTVCNSSYQPSDDPPLELTQELPVMIDASGGCVRARFRARDAQGVAGARLRVVLLVPVTRPEGAREVAFRPIEVPFDADGVAEVDVPVSQLDRSQPLPAGDREWPAALRRLSVILAG